MGNNYFAKYIPSNSVIHKLNSTFKIISLIILISSFFLFKNYIPFLIILNFLIFVMIISKIPIKYYFENIKIFLLLVSISLILNLFFNQEGNIILKFGFLKITDTGFKNSILGFIKILSLLLMNTILLFTTKFSNIINTMEFLMSPLKIINVNTKNLILTLTIATRFLPYLFEETDRIIIAQKSRGMNFNQKNIIKKIKMFIPLLLPIIISSFRRTVELAISIECRGYKH